MAPPESYWQRRQAFESLLAQPESARDAWLQALAERDAGLAQAVRARWQRWLEADAAAPDDGMPQVAGYRVLGRLGAGGMGQVWSVERLHTPGQTLALKQLHPGENDPERQRRFALECHILGRLQHPWIVPLVDSGMDAAGRPYLVTPRIDGLTLDQWVCNSRPTLRERVRVLRDLARALAHAHGMLVIHRDLKPGNVLVDSGGQVRVLDFGIARLLDGSSAVTTGQHSLMTLRYAAPEQVRGEPVGPGCDLYALGVLGYELVAGISPYQGHTQPAALTAAILQRDPPPPSHTPDAVQGADADVDAILLKLLRKAVADRYASALELAADLERWLAGQPVQARSEERGYLWRRWVRRHRWAMLVALMVPILLGLHVWRLDRQLAATARERDRATQVVEFFVQLFRQAPPGEAREGGVSARELLDRSVAQLQQAPPAEAGSFAALLAASGRAYADLGLPEQAAPLLTQATQLLRDAGTSSLQARLTALRVLAGVRYQLDQVEDSLAATLEGLDAMSAAGEGASERRAGFLQNAAIAEFTLGRDADARARLQEALGVLDTPELRATRTAVLLRQNLAAEAQGLGDLAAAAAHLEAALSGAQALQPDDPDLRFSLQRARLEVRLQLGTPPMDDLGPWLAPVRAHYGDHLETALWLELAGLERLQAGDRAAAERHLQAAATMAAQLFSDPDHNYRMRFARALWLLRAESEPAATAAGIAELIHRRQALAAPDSRELQLEQTLLAWVRCRLDPEQASAFMAQRDALLAEPAQDQAWQRWARTWQCVKNSQR